MRFLNIWVIGSSAETNDFNANLYTPDLDWETHDVLSGIKRDLSFKNVVRAIGGNATIADFQCESVEEYEELFSWITVERWKYAEESAVDVAVKEGYLSQEDAKKIKDSETTFDLLLDFDAYFADFIEFYGINLLKQEVDFFEFRWLLDALLEKEDSTLVKRIGYRAYTKDKNDSAKYAQFMYNNRKKYALSADDAVFKDNFDTLFQDAKSLGGGQNS